MARGGTLSDLLTTSASRTPDAIALRAGEDAWTFRELTDWSGRQNQAPRSFTVERTSPLRVADLLSGE